MLVGIIFRHDGLLKTMENVISRAMKPSRTGTSGKCTSWVLKEVVEVGFLKSTGGEKLDKKSKKIALCVCKV